MSEVGEKTTDNREKGDGTMTHARWLMGAIITVFLIGVNSSVQGSIVWNGGFDYSGGGTIGWPRGNSNTIMSYGTIDGHSALYRSVTTTGESYQFDDAAHLNDGPLYTINNSLGQATAAMPANEAGTANPGWNSTATSETYTFSFQYDKTGANGAGSVKLYAYTGTGSPPYDVNSQSYNYVPLGTLSTNWTLLYDSGALGSGASLDTWNNGPATGATGSLTGTISGQREYFGIVLTGVSGFALDSISLDIQSAADAPAIVPEPSAVLDWSLLGGLGLAFGAWWKRKVA